MRTKSPKPAAITELPLSPDEERHQRVLKYTLAMGIRMVCIVACVFTPGWWLLIPAAGAIALPYLAVVVANVGAKRTNVSVERPGGVIEPFDPRRIV